MSSHFDLPQPEDIEILNQIHTYMDDPMTPEEIDELFAERDYE